MSLCLISDQLNKKVNDGSVTKNNNQLNVLKNGYGESLPISRFLAWVTLQ